MAFHCLILVYLAFFCCLEFLFLLIFFLCVKVLCSCVWRAVPDPLILSFIYPLSPKGPVIIYRLGGVGGFWAKHDEI